MLSGHMTQNNKISVPWGAISRDADRYLDTEYIPPNILIGEISKMKSADLHRCLGFWIDRQKEGKISFRFKNVVSDDIRGPTGKRRRAESRTVIVDKDSEDKDETGKSKAAGREAM
jgi:hypothetical protein